MKSNKLDLKLGFAQHFGWLPGPVLDPWSDGKMCFLAARASLNDVCTSKKPANGLQKVSQRKKVQNLALNAPKY